MTPKPAVPAAQLGFGTPFAEQIEFFRRKLNLPTEWWDDIERSVHDRAFIVAGAGTADLVQDLRGAMDKAMGGLGLAGFRKDFKAIVAKQGWTGWTGEGSAKGEAWRTAIIYRTNMATAYSAGRYRQLSDPEFARLMPYWRYRHADGVLSPRPLHLAWNNLTLPQSHPFWKTHFPPNGWGCSCKVFATAAPDADAKLVPPAGWDKINPATGAPVGIDKGFDYQPGANATTPLQDLIDRKLIKLDGPLASEVRRAMEPVLAAEREAAAQALATAARSVASVAPGPLAFEAQATAKAAGEWAVKNNLVDRADFAGVKPEVANAWNESLFSHLQEFPALRVNQKFTGTCQAQVTLWREGAVERYFEKTKARSPGRSDAELRAFAERYIKPLKISGKAMAHSTTTDPDFSGVAVNRKWGADTAMFKRALATDVQTKFHPIGCDSIRSVADHELGHQLDGLLGLAQDAEVKALFVEARALGMMDAVSKYADRNIVEFIAETWAESLNNHAPRTYAKRIAEIVRTRYAARFPKP